MVDQTRMARGVALLAGNGLIAYEMFKGFRDGAPNMAALQLSTLGFGLVFCVIGLEGAYRMIALAGDEDPGKWQVAQRAAIACFVMLSVTGLLSTPLGAATIEHIFSGGLFRRD